MVMYGINHYIILIKHLTNQSTNINMKNELRDLILESPENLQVAISMTEIMTDVKIKIQELFFESLIAKIEKEGYEINNKDNFEENRSGYVQRKYYDFNICVLKSTNVDLFWSFEVGEGILCYGFFGENLNDEKLVSLIKEIIRSCNENYKSNENWLGRKDSIPLINFKNLNDQSIALVNKSKREEIVARLVDEMKENIEFVRSKMKDLGL